MAQSRIAMILRHGLEAAAAPFPLLPPGWVLLKTLYASWTGIEDYIAHGLYPVEKPRILGASAVARVVETTPGTENLAGELVAATKLTKHGIPGIDYDGFLVTHAAAPAEALEPIDEATPLHSLALHASLACDAALYLETLGAARVQVTGAGIYAVILALAARERGLSVALESPASSRLPCGLRSGKINSPDAHVVATASPWKPTAEVIVTHPLAPPPAMPRGDPGREYRVYTPRGSKRNCWEQLLRKHVNCLERITITAPGPVEPPPREPWMPVIYTPRDWGTR